MKRREIEEGAGAASEEGAKEEVDKPGLKKEEGKKDHEIVKEDNLEMEEDGKKETEKVEGEEEKFQAQDEDQSENNEAEKGATSTGKNEEMSKKVEKS